MLMLLSGSVIVAGILILIVLYYEVYKPIWEERKAAKGRYATKEDIDDLLHEAGIIDASEIQK